MAVRSPTTWERRLLAVGVVVLLALIVLLLLHFLLMPVHHGGEGCDSCAVALIGGLVMASILALHAGTGRAAATAWGSRPLQPPPAVVSGRHPPPRGVVLRL